MSIPTYTGPAIYCYVCGKATKDNRDICSSFCAAQDTRADKIREVRLYPADEQKIRQHLWTLDLICDDLGNMYVRYEDEQELPELDEVDQACYHVEEAMRELKALLASGLSLIPTNGNHQLPLEVA